MGGKNRSRRQQTAENTGGDAASLERQRATDLHNNLQARSDIIGTGLPGVMQQTREAASNLATTGGIDPTRAGYDTYADFAKTGGFTPEQEQEFLRRGTAGTEAIYTNTKDQMDRQKSLQGGYSPGFDASSAKLTREAANATANAGLGARVSLADQERQGKLAGAGGMQTIERATQQGKIAGQDALQRYSAFGVSALNENDVTELRNRLQSGELSMADAQLLTTLASQDKTAFQNIMAGIQMVGGAAAGIGTGLGSVGVKV